MLGAMAEGHSLLEWMSSSLDVRTTWSCLMALGAAISSTPSGEQIAVRGLGWRGLVQPKQCLKAGDSAATVRLLMGVIAANPIGVDIIGDEGLQRVSLSGVAAPLRQMGASITLRGGGQSVPACVLGAALKGALHIMPQSCEQVKAAVLLAGTMAIGETSVREPLLSGTRLENLLALFGAEVRREGLTTTVQGGLNLAGQRLAVPPDLSWAAFWALAAGLLAGGEIFIEGLSMEDGRAGVFGALSRMGLRPEWHAAGLRIRTIRLSGADVPWEQASADLPLLALAASQADGPSRLRGALGDGRDRVARLIRLLKGFGIQADVDGEDLVVSGLTPLKSSIVCAGEDVQFARAALLAGLLADGETSVSEARVVSDRYPGLIKEIARLR
jgi:3-phosphoshikimate 1-carboxyvinyltransferase